MNTKQSIRHDILKKWYQNITKNTLFESDIVEGSSPPSVFVGEYGYPKVMVGPMVPQVHGNTSILDSPEEWSGKSLNQIINYRLNLVRGTKKIGVKEVTGRYIEGLQEMAMASHPTDSQLEFTKKTSISFDESLFGPMGQIQKMNISNSRSIKTVENTFYDNDLKADEAIIHIYNNDVEISKISRCLSIGMFGHDRKIVPTKWSITATDSIISKYLVNNIIDFPVIDSCKVFSFTHLDNVFVVLLFPHRWMYEMVEAWTGKNNTIEFGSDLEDTKRVVNSPSIAGAYFAAKLAIAEYLYRNDIQAGVLVLREIRPQYAIPVGVWQIREGVRQAMRNEECIVNNFQEGFRLATAYTSIEHKQWSENMDTINKMKQHSIEQFV